jgi:carbamoyl-phosphate synthase large subunit
VRPSYVLSGAGMIVASDEEQLKEYLSSDAVKISRSISVSRLILNTMEIEFDGVAKDGSILNYAMS